MLDRALALQPSDAGQRYADSADARAVRWLGLRQRGVWPEALCRLGALLEDDENDLDGAERQYRLALKYKPMCVRCCNVDAAANMLLACGGQGHADTAAV